MIITYSTVVSALKENASGMGYLVRVTLTSVSMDASFTLEVVVWNPTVTLVDDTVIIARK